MLPAILTLLAVTTHMENEETPRRRHRPTTNVPTGGERASAVYSVLQLRTKHLPGILVGLPQPTRRGILGIKLRMILYSLIERLFFRQF
jgi:hypothetical protein